MKIVEIIANASEYQINSVSKATIGFERTDSSVERCSTVGDETAVHATRKSFMREKVNHCGKLHCCLILRNCQKKVIVGLYKIMYVKLLIIVKHCRMQRSFHSIKKKETERSNCHNQTSATIIIS